MIVAEPGFVVDVLDLYIGMGSTKPPVNITGGLMEQIKTLQQQLQEFGSKNFKQI